MFFICSISNREEKLDYIQNIICDKCGCFGRMEVYMTYTYLSLFFIPLFKWSKKYYVKYTCCNSIYILDNEIGTKISHGKEVFISEDNLHLVDYNLPVIKKCENCDYTYNDDFEYCPKCGQKLKF